MSSENSESCKQNSVYDEITVICFQFMFGLSRMYYLYSHPEYHKVWRSLRVLESWKRTNLMAFLEDTKLKVFL